MNAPDLDSLLPRLGELRGALAQAVVGQQEVVEQLLIGLLAGGHCLLEGAPGLGKTLLVRSLGQALHLQFRRVQFTPDLMPSDILGTELLEEDHGTGKRAFRFQQGPVFTNLLLADELNRTPPKTQAALLEAMQEKTVSYAGVTHELPAPFCYLAGHKLVEFNPDERRNFERYLRNGGFVFVDDCNHDIDGLFAKSFEDQMAAIFGATALRKLPNSHPLYSSFFKFPDGPPATGFELNGWGDDLVHDYLKGISIDGRLGVLYSNKDYGCEWDYDWRNKRWLAEDNTKFGVNIAMYALTS